MSFIVEDGHGISDANSYVSVRFADDFLAYRTDFDWSTRTTDQKQAALVQATAYVDARYGRLFAGPHLRRRWHGRGRVPGMTAFPSC